MQLSVCVITADPPGQVAAVLETVRPIADEIVIAADHRVGPQAFAAYAEIADVLHAVEFVRAERHLGWLLAQCRGAWILRLDGDELPSAALVRRLPELLAERAVAQYCLPTAWCHERPERVLDESPWASDFTNRLVRNTGAALRTGGQQHQHALTSLPLRHEPEPVYHLDLLLSSAAERRAKAVRYEAERPHMRAAGGGRINEAFYLPELRTSAPQTRSAPAEDVEAIERVIAAARLPLRDAELTLPVVALAELDRYWPGRAVRPDDYAARIVAHGTAPFELEPDEWGACYVSVTNLGDELWPAGLDDQPAIRLAYHLEAPDGTVLEEGGRSPFGRPVAPGEEALVRLAVAAPPQPGGYVVAVDALHEDHAWFGATCRIPLRVRAQQTLPPVGGRLVQRRAPPGASLLIPRVVHRVWLGDAPLPGEFVAYGETFRRDNPGWELRLWGDDDLEGLGIGPRERVRARSASELSNLVRYAILAREGGVYVDTDVESRRGLEKLLHGVEAFAALELPGRVGSAVLGAIPAHPLFVRAAAESRVTNGSGPCSPDGTGPYFLSLLVEQEPAVTVFGHEHFYPYSWTEPERRHEQFPDAYCVHHWSLSWRPFEAR